LKEITIFKSVGVALQDIAVAISLFENAVRLGLGTQLDPYVAGRHFVETR
jgi:ornithine cyclodeaminase/alanine dehydrogenase-like protein (mu-crystallin family)